MRRVILVVSLGLVAVCSIVGNSSAATVSYIAGDSLWLSSPDGSQKKKLAGPTEDGRAWNELAQADNGKVLAVRREPGKISQLNSFTLFGPGGDILQQGSLTHENGWSTYAYPVTLDLTNDGTAVYGYSNMNPGFPMGTFESGTYVRTVEKPFILPPFEITGWEWPTLFGDRLVATQGQFVYVQPSGDSGSPYGDDPSVGFLQVPDGFEINRTDVAANGRIFGLELNYNMIELYPIDRVADIGQNTTIGSGGCVLPTQGDASHITISQDGKDIAWEDDRGVLSAGAPDFAGADPCSLTRAPVVLASNGEYPSIGAAKISTGGGGSLVPVPTVPGRVKATALRNGIWVTVKVARAGQVTLVGKVGRNVVARGNTKTRKAGKVRVKLMAVGAWRNRLAQLKGRTLVITVTSAGKSKTVRRVLK